MTGCGTTLGEHEAVWGLTSSDQLRKSDLPAIPPGKLQIDFPWHSEQT